ncbi:hypothetical protein K469DRAFT_698474 [Zopfia rhizophila CBS 207.26]|uniref:Uncharacterized protein n=1 Tax=Zopfia rhizophila CBS 207.26 TaxID=1314779 RepID=A0A6A6EV81_9PEZI|nr:hypothetical protein K469DRAFT_698474 [Zopfia rhizophila CBS 207.26]
MLPRPFAITGFTLLFVLLATFARHSNVCRHGEDAYVNFHSSLHANVRTSYLRNVAKKDEAGRNSDDHDYAGIYQV